MFWHRLMRGKTARIIIASGTSPWLVRLLPGNVNAQLKWGILWFAGFSVHTTWFGPSENIPEGRKARWLDGTSCGSFQVGGPASVRSGTGPDGRGAPRASGRRDGVGGQLVDAERLAPQRKLAAYKHDRFWQSMDTLRDVRVLEAMWQKGGAPWKNWE